MARRGAMTKNPVLRGEARKAAQVARRAAEEGRPEASPPVTAKPRETRGERLSPGVYRGSEGNLLTQGGRQIQRQPQAPMQPAPPQGSGMQIDPGYAIDPGYFNPEMGSVGQQMPMDKMFRFPQMPQASANMGGQYRLSPGVYGNQQQAMNQYNQQMQQMGIQPAMMPYRTMEGRKG
jgi:hypothetical protein